jgi:hypothetical protein
MASELSLSCSDERTELVSLRAASTRHDEAIETATDRIAKLEIEVEGLRDIIAQFREAVGLAASIRAAEKQLAHNRVVFFMLRKTPSGRSSIVQYALADTLVASKSAAEMVMRGLLAEYVGFLKRHGEQA